MLRRAKLRLLTKVWRQASGAREVRPSAGPFEVPPHTSLSAWSCQQGPACSGLAQLSCS